MSVELSVPTPKMLGMEMTQVVPSQDLTPIFRER